MSTLTIISHTEHYKKPDGTIVGLGPTVTEINHLLEIFEAIIHVGMLHTVSAPSSALPYASNKITFVPLPAVGGTNLRSKLDIIWKAPKIIGIIKKALRTSDYFQFRAPTGIGVFVIPYLVLFSNHKGWYKYAGNWKQENAPLAYSFQRWLLKKQKQKVTINGKWNDQPSHCLTFENPCLTQDELTEGHDVIKKKQFNSEAVDFCFIGRLEEEKGIGILIHAFKALDISDQNRIGSIHIVGDGKLHEYYRQQTVDSKLNFIFHGYLSREDVHHIYNVSHAIILPSASEGFPKVISEAMNYGCLPIVSDVSSISNYVIDDKNGFLLSEITETGLKVKIQKMLHLSDVIFSRMIASNDSNIYKFTYSYYNHRIKSEILSI
ncbi:glycosyltransferase family 4 protein [Winogradskyella eckloniae]|uniref:glycosyltransferase n=1 Tax=Winogradskyella eckloniae TaxID=1089306 RepID=UPI0015669846|nr:glycosyltransferase [Winogradskyella eckloniae]NRD20542.1 glycosyltransferase family 4 protein [Winogradskyella eckloniae]